MQTAVLRKLIVLCVVCGLVGLALLGTAAICDKNREWKQYQADYRELLLEKIDRASNPVLYDRVESMQPEIKQIVIDELGTVDRCTTCHMGIEDSLFESARQPLARHPRPELLEAHPVEKFGCTICHGGQGAATTYKDASHRSITHWPDPMVDSSLLQSRCGYCHDDYEMIGAEKLILGKILFEDMYCSGCHKVEPDDGAMAPALSALADKDIGYFDFSHVEGDQSKQNWILKHFQSPQTVTPGTPMRSYAMNGFQREALTTYVLSLTERVFLKSFYPKDKPAGEKTACVAPVQVADLSE